MLSLSIEAITQFLITSICLICSWSLAFLFIWLTLKTTKEGVYYLKRLHQIPCSRCAFFTNDYRLKCTVHPIAALSESAINCCDFEPGASYNISVVKQCNYQTKCSNFS
ncbi:MAG: hypothetical protein F6K31_09310 [Symploca sp. SIO2G7]|nr:hypothetical protein [Symploca sp. SIO2G7]